MKTRGWGGDGTWLYTHDVMIAMVDLHRSCIEWAHSTFHHGGRRAWDALSLPKDPWAVSRY